jgi:hypothetical protein
VRKSRRKPSRKSALLEPRPASGLNALGLTTENGCQLWPPFSILPLNIQAFWFIILMLLLMELLIYSIIYQLIRLFEVKNYA